MYVYVCIYMHTCYVCIYIQKCSCKGHPLLDSDVIHTMGQCCMWQNGNVSKLNQRKRLQNSLFLKGRTMKGMHKYVDKQTAPENYKEH